MLRLVDLEISDFLKLKLSFSLRSGFLWVLRLLDVVSTNVEICVITLWLDIGCLIPDVLFRLNLCFGLTNFSSVPEVMEYFGRPEIWKSCQFIWYEVNSV